MVLLTVRPVDTTWHVPLPSRTKEPVLVAQELTRDIIVAFAQAHAPCVPHVVISHLQRRKLDANRDCADAALGDPEAERSW